MLEKSPAGDRQQSLNNVHSCSILGNKIRNRLISYVKYTINEIFVAETFICMSFAICNWKATFEHTALSILSGVRSYPDQ